MRWTIGLQNNNAAIIRCVSGPLSRLIHHASGSTCCELTLNCSEHSLKCQSFCNHFVIRIPSSLPRHTRCQTRARLRQRPASTCHHERDTNNTTQITIHQRTWHIDDFQCLRYNLLCSTSLQGRSSTSQMRPIYQVPNLAAPLNVPLRHHSLREPTLYH